MQDLIGKLTVPVAWLIAGTAVAAWLFGKFYRRQTEAARRIEREVIFNEKILANMPSGIALVDPHHEVSYRQRSVRANGETLWTVTRKTGTSMKRLSMK